MRSSTTAWELWLPARRSLIDCRTSREAFQTAVEFVDSDGGWVAVHQHPKTHLVPADLAEVIMACLAKDPGVRPDCADEVSRILADMDEAATVSLVSADQPTEDPVADDVPM